MQGTADLNQHAIMDVQGRACTVCHVTFPPPTAVLPGAACAAAPTGYPTGPSRNWASQNNSAQCMGVQGGVWADGTPVVATTCSPGEACQHTEGADMVPRLHAASKVASTEGGQPLGTQSVHTARGTAHDACGRLCAWFVISWCHLHSRPVCPRQLLGLQ
jgi:hypothetical protein